MNVNSYNYFSQQPSVNVRRSTFDMSFSNKTTANTGDLIPIFCQEVLPGDTIELQTSKVVRMQTLLTPLMDNVFLDTMFFYVPNYLIWEHWNAFCGENTESAWIPQTKYQIPQLKPGTISVGGNTIHGFHEHSIADYFGIPVNMEFPVDKDGVRLGVNALPFRAYALICDSFFRDQNLTDPLNINKGDADLTHDYSEVPDDDDYIDEVIKGGRPFRAAKMHDYFTSALPAPQKGAPVQMPVNAGASPLYGNFMPVVPISNDVLGAYLYDQGDSKVSPVGLWFGNDLSSYSFANRQKVTSGSSTDEGNPVNTVNPENLTPYYGNGYLTNLGADPSALPLGFDINSLRLAFSTQSYLEALARGGSRYSELLGSIFGVRSPDARLNEPEYLGGSRVPLQIHQVTSTSESEQAFLGSVGGMSVTSDSNYDFRKSFTDHGYIVGVAVARYEHTYADGLDRMWTVKDFLDLYNPYFSNIGEQPIYNYEVFVSGDADEDGWQVNPFDAFGYQQAWSRYRYRNNMVTGEMRPKSSRSLDIWHLADDYNSTPFLSNGWIREDKSNVDRTLAVSSALADQYFMDLYFKITATRPLPMYSIPGLGNHE